ncbi:MAG: tRNA nucleotidyltransferase, partial [Bacteroidetes bacterium]|nr:tRNA nucleotidyltransferase [Bacteroidota bacterium]
MSYLYMHICLYDDVFKLISKVLDSEGTRGFVIGGYVRDRLLGRNTEGKDIDILVVGDGVDIARKVAKISGKNRKVTVFRNFGTAMFRHGDI